MDYAIETRSLVKRYGTAEALAGIDLRAEPGSVLCLLGPNGAGKTTVVRTLTTLLRPDGGSARVAGFDVVRDASRVRAAIGVTGQFAAVDELMTGYQNLLLVGRLIGLSRRQAGLRAGELLERMSLDGAADRLARTYSGGMRRRLDLAAGMLHEPRVLLLDEPTTGLDPRSRSELWQVVRDLVGGGTTVLLTTQYLEEADRLADHIALLDGGRVVATGTPRDLKQGVGGHRVQFRPPQGSLVPEAVVAATRWTGRAAVAEGDTVRVPLDDPARFPDLAARLMAAGLAGTEISLGHPSLDEVFLSLTGLPQVSRSPQGAGHAPV
ncbi:ATP-binding cassette domain-containing protein [Streptomyces sp. A3M-1-3]|uniref:ATP-binding cassette domain-containing protein n=1 Tax=Streptomyces sp. A3M-1-3 TaxID=2962044 RepID=UPI0020B6C7A2|nr:ATP-binding cassette domain-containing protein [Streptomyces sp. A3M-1-3]MCP3821621.1 ATP-binding cassette domain-containing protein [Streptomyces sp. A3M-1-3]